MLTRMARMLTRMARMTRSLAYYTRSKIQDFNGVSTRITNQILQIIGKKQRERKEEICVINSKARKTNLFNATRERSYKVIFTSLMTLKL